ncbi:uncharacterized protein LOC143275643 [Babylonia areolata]|uniref:uncharacterized protein LOC143275643 n=1 Tax=Babylonia areolata TaxID=304850 RepID=UPI003FD5ED4D
MAARSVISFCLCCVFVVCIVNCCEDKNAMCQEWAARGECTNNPAYMLPNCQISCQQCGGGSNTGGSTGDCQDRNPSCQSWAASGECVTNPAYMFGHCQRSCDSCGVSIVG